MLKTKLGIYLVFLVKVIFSIIFIVSDPSINDLYISTFSIVTIFYSCALAYIPDYGLIAIILLFTTLLILLLAVITMLLGIFFHSARKVSVYLITFLVLVDFVVSFFIADLLLKLACIIVSSIYLTVCISVLKKK